MRTVVTWADRVVRITDIFLSYKVSNGNNCSMTEMESNNASMTCALGLVSDFVFEVIALTHV